MLFWRGLFEYGVAEVVAARRGTREGLVRLNQYVSCGGRFYSDIHGSMIVSSRVAASLIRSIRQLAVVLLILSARIVPARAEQEPSTSFEVAKNDFTKAQALATQLASLSPKVDPKEANAVAERAYATASRLRSQYHMFGTPIFNNFLVYHGLRKRGYCYQWTEDLLLALDALKLKTLELHWGEAYADTYRENNCLVITAKGQPFERGMILEAWRHFGHLRWNLLASDEDRYYENAKWAARVREQARSKSLESNGHVGLQTKVTRHGKAGDR